LQSLKLKEDLRGADDSSLAPALFTLAELDADEGKPQAGLQKLDQLMKLQGMDSRRNTQATLVYQLAHARLLCEAKQREAGLMEIEGLLAQARLAESNAPLARAGAFQIRGDCLLAMGEGQAARAALQESLDLRQPRLPEDHPEVHRLRALLAADEP
jgi:predicted negative regulator of RcsB-dependent stress response